MQAGSIINTAVRTFVLDLELLSLLICWDEILRRCANLNISRAVEATAYYRGLRRKDLLIVIQLRLMTEPPIASCLFDTFVKSMKAMINDLSQVSRTPNTLPDFRSP